MSDTTQTLVTSLDQAEAQLRDILQRLLVTAPMNARLVGGILTHVVNIKRSVSTSQRDHAQAAKRLGDFAVTMDRIAKRTLDAGDLAAQITALAQLLRTVGAALTIAEAAPELERAAG